MQRAADAAALAGVVLLPGDAAARLSAGHDRGRPRTATPTASRASPSPRSRIRSNTPPAAGHDLGAGQHVLRARPRVRLVHRGRTSKAEYVLPVPMGSPENYYGVFGLTRGLTRPARRSSRTPPPRPATRASARRPDRPGRDAVDGVERHARRRAVQTNDNIYGGQPTNRATQHWSAFGLLSGGAAVPIRVGQTLLDRRHPGRSTTVLDQRGLRRFDDQGRAVLERRPTWSGPTSRPRTMPSTRPRRHVDCTLPAQRRRVDARRPGAATRHTWIRSDFATRTSGSGSPRAEGARQRGHVQPRPARGPGLPGHDTRRHAVTDHDHPGRHEPPGARARAADGAANCDEADGAALNPRGFWGDAEHGRRRERQRRRLSSRTTTRPPAPSARPARTIGPTRPAMTPTHYYNYAVEMPPGATGGRSGSTTRSSATSTVDQGHRRPLVQRLQRRQLVLRAVRHENTLYDNDGDGTQLATSGSLFRSIAASDTTMGGSGGCECKYCTTAHVRRRPRLPRPLVPAVQPG